MPSADWQTRLNAPQWLHPLYGFLRYDSSCSEALVLHAYKLWEAGELRKCAA